MTMAGQTAQSYSNVPLTPVTLENSENARAVRGRVLFVDTTYPSFGKEWSASVFFPPKLADEAASWVPQEYGCGPDVPLDCIYSAGDVSPVERCDEVCGVVKDMERES